eukprot:COSAG01_NODE_7890_length_3004_cov_8.444062_2_plen_31_part_00
MKQKFMLTYTDFHERLESIGLTHLMTKEYE